MNQINFLKMNNWSRPQDLYLSCSPQRHTSLIGSKSFHKYIFKGCISLKTLKLWLLVLTKTLFKWPYIKRWHILDNIFIKVKKKIARVAPPSQKNKIKSYNSCTSTIDAPPGVLKDTTASPKLKFGGLVP